MQTPTHLLLGAAAFGLPGRHRMIGALIGGILPDAWMAVMIAVVISQERTDEMWEVVYWSEPWQTVGAIANSFPLWLVVVALGWWRRQHRLGQAVLAAGLAAVAHLITDFALHADDAHRHFWPLSNWRFHSPVSYWDPDHHSVWVAPIELLLAIVSGVVLYRRSQRQWFGRLRARAGRRWRASPGP